jgi:hypothetical protein
MKRAKPTGLRFHPWHGAILLGLACWSMVCVMVAALWGLKLLLIKLGL